MFIHHPQGEWEFALQWFSKLPFQYSTFHAKTLLATYWMEMQYFSFLSLFLHKSLTVLTLIFSNLFITATHQTWQKTSSILFQRGSEMWKPILKAKYCTFRLKCSLSIRYQQLHQFKEKFYMTKDNVCQQWHSLIFLS